LEKKELFVFFRKLLGEESCQEIGLEAMDKISRLEAERVPEGFTRSSFWTLLEENEILPVLEELLESPSSNIKKLVERILGIENVEK